MRVLAWGRCLGSGVTGHDLAEVTGEPVGSPSSSEVFLGLVPSSYPCPPCWEPLGPWERGQGEGGPGDAQSHPQVNSEYYTGWLDYWGEPHAGSSPATVARGLRDILQLGASVNM